MGRFSRRKFLGGLAVSGAAALTVPRDISAESLQRNSLSVPAGTSTQAIDFRYSPHLSQATICFPDDPNKSLVDQSGDLRYGFAKELMVGMEDFANVCRFSLAGMQDDRVVRQWLEAPHVPIVHTLIERPTATIELTAFATRHGNEGRVDNVLMTILPKQTWQFFKDLEPNVRRALDFLVQLRDRAKAENSTKGRYGLLAPGFADARWSLPRSFSGICQA